MPASLLIAGLPAGYFALSSMAIGGSFILANTPPLARLTVSKIYRWKNYYLRFSCKDDPEMSKAILGWIFAINHQIKGSGNMIEIKKEDGKTYSYKLPIFNKRVPIKTKYGKIYVRVLSLDNVHIAGFELSVQTRSYFSLWFKSKKEINKLNYFVKALSLMVGIVPTGEIGSSFEPKTIYDNRDVKAHFPASYYDWLKKNKGKILLIILLD